MAFRRRFRSILPAAVLCTTLILACRVDDGGDHSTAPPWTPKDKVVSFTYAQANECQQAVVGIEFQTEPSNPNPDTNAARAQWRRARAAYEKMRFMVEQYLPVIHHNCAAWFSEPLYQGFHFIERILFATRPVISTAELNVENLHANVLQVLDSTHQLKRATVTDTGIFLGLQHMLADIDTVKFSLRDSAWSSNSYNDVQNNYVGLDTVYGFYRDTVVARDTAADARFRAALATARATLLSAGSLQALDRASYRTHELADLQAALRAVAATLRVTIP